MRCAFARLAALLLALAVATPASATLLGRDIDGNPIVGSDPAAVFLYDTDLNITWLRDANVNGALRWNDAMQWADDLTVGKWSDWRLPSTPNCFGLCSNSEMGHLYSEELGNQYRIRPVNAGDFLNLVVDPQSVACAMSGSVSCSYWTNRYAGDDRHNVFIYQMWEGNQAFTNPNTETNFAMAVRDGDVAAVPELPASGMLLAGGLVLTFIRLRASRHHGPASSARPATCR